MLETPRILRYSSVNSGSDNAPGADNQQERLWKNEMLDVTTIPDPLGYYLSGFTDGEGSFNISFRPRSDYRHPWKISLCFNISQKEQAILLVFVQTLSCGTMRSRPDGVWYYEVNTFDAIISNVIPFFERFSFLSAKKQRDFGKFCQVARMMERGEHLTQQGVEEILEIRNEMNGGGKRRYSNAEILSRFQSKESSETTRQTSIKLDDDIVRTA